MRINLLCTMNSSYCAPRSNSVTHKSLLEAWAAIKIPQHLILISLLYEAEGLGISLQDHKNKRQLFTEEKKWETDEFTSAPISFLWNWSAARTNRARCPATLSAAQRCCGVPRLTACC